MLWCCPTHHGTLILEASQLRAECCGRVFPVVEGIPDLRVAHTAWIDFDDDLEAAPTLSATIPREDVPASVRAVFARRPGWSAERVTERTSRTLAFADRMREEWQGWLASTATHSGPILDIGCGAGSFLTVAPVGMEKVGVDVSMEWLVVAQRICDDAGVPVQLAAALAESLPLRASTVGVVTALDVIEHVGDQAAMVREIDRVRRPGGKFHAATPNRYSVGAEPHVGVWGVGWIPRTWQEGYVRRRTGLPHNSIRLLSRPRHHCPLPSRGVIQPADPPSTDTGS